MANTQSKLPPQQHLLQKRILTPKQRQQQREQQLTLELQKRTQRIPYIRHVIEWLLDGIEPPNSVLVDPQQLLDHWEESEAAQASLGSTSRFNAQHARTLVWHHQGLELVRPDHRLRHWNRYWTDWHSEFYPNFDLWWVKTDLIRAYAFKAQQLVDQHICADKSTCQHPAEHVQIRLYSRKRIVAIANLCCNTDWYDKLVCIRYASAYWPIYWIAVYNYLWTMHDTDYQDAKQAARDKHALAMQDMPRAEDQ